MSLKKILMQMLEDWGMIADPGTAFIDTFEDKPDEDKPSQNELIHKNEKP